MEVVLMIVELDFIKIYNYFASNVELDVLLAQMVKIVCHVDKDLYNMFHLILVYAILLIPNIMMVLPTFVLNFAQQDIIMTQVHLIIFVINVD